MDETAKEALRQEAQPLIDADKVVSRTCWICNEAHAWMKQRDDVVINCFACGRWLYKGHDLTIWDDQSPEPTGEDVMSDQTGPQKCTSSGLDVGRMLPIPGSDDWHIECPTCGMWWAGGSTVLPEHNRPR